MMKRIDLNTCDELEEKVEILHKSLESKKASKHGTISKPLFRGQRCALLRLETTLERYLSKTNVPVNQYNSYLLKIKPAVESYTGNKWKLKQHFKIDLPPFRSPPNYEFMAYLRHHGFPSPLLDWSQSLYIALFFAFQKASIKKRVAIYTYVEYLGKGKSVGRDTQVYELGPYVSAHKRHLMQQGQYTICAKMVNNEWVYCSHEEYFSLSNGGEQDYLIKYTLPGDIKNQVLKKLQCMNINAFTLFGSEDSLMDMLAFKEIVK